MLCGKINLQTLYSVNEFLTNQEEVFDNLPVSDTSDIITELSCIHWT